MRKYTKSFVFLSISVLLFACNGAGTASSPATTSQTVTPVTYQVQEQFANGEARDESLPLEEIHTDLQKQFLTDPNMSLTEVADGKEEKSFPRANTLKVGEDEKTRFVELATTADFTNSKIYETTGSLPLENLLLATHYYYRVAESKADLAKSEVKGFQSSFMAPRNVQVDGVTNFRDIGGWVTIDKKRTKQGLIYRCGRFNESGVKAVNKEITAAGEKTLLQDLGMKTEVDLRYNDYDETGGLNGASCVAGLAYQWFPFSKITIKDNKETVKNIFACLADKTNYPLCFHCNIGTDRTGMITMLYNGILGVPFDSLVYDYVFSNFGLIGGKRTYDMIKDGYIAEINAFAGNSFASKCEAVLLDLGVTSTQINSIRDIMLSN
jgi:protein-tyrosine phosphatase